MATKSKTGSLIELGQGSLPDYYLPGGEQWINKLDDTKFIGSMKGHRYRDPDMIRSSRWQWLGEDIGEVDTTFDYEKLGLSDALLGQISNLFTARGTGGMKDRASQYAIWENSPEGSTDPEDMTKLDETGAYGAVDFSKYANIFDKNSLAQMLSMIAGRQITKGELPSITGRDVAETQESFYTPLEVKKRGSLIDQIMSKYNTESSYGGLAGSSGRDRSLRGIRDAYNVEMENIWGDIGEAAGTAEQSLSDKLSQLHDLTTSLG